MSVRGRPSRLSLGFGLGGRGPKDDKGDKPKARARRAAPPTNVRVEPRVPKKAKAERKRAEVDPRHTAAVRVRWVGAAFALGVVLVAFRAYQLQIVRGASWDDASRRQAVTSATIQAKRGVVKDRHGAELAISVDVDSVYAEPRRFEDINEQGTARVLNRERVSAAAHGLSPLLGVPVPKLEEQLSSGRGFVYLARRVAPEVAASVRALGLVGVATQPEAQRFFPKRELAAHVVGFTDGEGRGQAGVERRFEETLAGKSYEVPGLRDALGRSVWSEGYVPQAVLEGDDVLLTIDSAIQRAAEDALEQTVRSQEAKAGIAIVLDPKEGDVLAMASWPTFNPNNLSDAGPDVQLNRAVSAVYEPGSTLKMVTIAAGLEEHQITAASTIDCEKGHWRVGNRTIRDTHPYAQLSIGEVMKVSSNICSAKIGFMLGSNVLHTWLAKFGFGEPTGVELPGELGGLLRPAARWRDIELANVAFGQGLSVTPLQVAQAAAVIASGGYRVKPRIVRATVDKAGNRVDAPVAEPVRVLSADTAATVRDMMAEVTRKGGTAELAAIPGFSVAGKTGTAQKIDPVTKAYSRSLYIASFVGFVPAEAPEVVVLVLIDEPGKAIYGGQVAAPAWKTIATTALAARGVFPSDPEAQAAFLAAAATPDKGKNLLSAEAQALLGEGGAAIEPVVEAAVAVLEPGTAAPGAETSRKMPDFAGLPIREVLNRSAEVHCDLVLTGTGRVVQQTPRAGAELAAGERCELVLSPRG